MIKNVLDRKLNLSYSSVDTSVLLIKLSGVLDSENSYNFQDHISTLITNYNQVIFDCEKLSYISSSGIGAFTYFKTVSNDLGFDMKIINMQDKVIDVFKVLGFYNLFNL